MGGIPTANAVFRYRAWAVGVEGKVEIELSESSRYCIGQYAYRRKGGNEEFGSYGECIAHSRAVEDEWVPWHFVITSTSVHGP